MRMRRCCPIKVKRGNYINVLFRLQSGQFIFVIITMALMVLHINININKLQIPLFELLLFYAYQNVINIQNTI